MFNNISIGSAIIKLQQIYNFIHHKVAINSKKYSTMVIDNRETDKILTNLHRLSIYRSEYNDIQCTSFYIFSSIFQMTKWNVFWDKVYYDIHIKKLFSSLHFTAF